MIFDQLNDLIFDKTVKCMNNVDHETDYSQYMINRWTSMYSDEMANIINNTVNWLYPIFETKLDHYNFLHCVLPQAKRKRINYVKKIKPDEPDKDDDNTHDVEMLARNLQLSQREVQQMLDMS